MNMRFLAITGGVVGLVVAGVIGWWLASPLFINQTVDEGFPISEQAAPVADETPTEQPTTAPEEDEVAQLPAPTREALEATAMVEAEDMPDTEMDDPMPEEAAVVPEVILNGQFGKVSDSYDATGNATIYQLPEGNHILRLENFEVTNGPALRVLLATSPNPATSEELGDYVDLGALKGNIGNQNYDIPADIDISQYQSVVIYCEPFHVVFSYASLDI
ncbi:MAG: DM13 domain-containing protein [Chloroflexota bacterium]